MLVFPTFFFPYMSKLSTLGTVQQKRIFNPETMKNEFNRSEEHTSELQSR